MTLADAFKGGQPLHDRIVEDVFFLWTIDRED